MAPKKSKTAPAGDDIDELFEGIGADPGKPAGKPKPTTAASKALADQDILAELEDQLSGQPPSRPHTPRVSKDIAAAAKGSPARRAAGTPPQGGDEKAAARKSTESSHSLRASFTPSATSSDLQDAEKKGSLAEPAAAPGAGGGWWGGLIATASATATAAMKQAEAAVKEIQQNEEARRWADQVRGNVGALQNLSDDLRQRAMPTFTNILHTLAPPISSHERLLIHITHDLVGYPSLDPLIHGVFARVMAQVEGGDLLVVQRGHESTSRASAESSAGWRDGPWWRQADSPRDLGLVKGLVEGTKLCRAGAEAYATEYFASRGGLDGARARATEPLSESNPVRSSDLFMAVQAIGLEADPALFARGSAAEHAVGESLAKAPEQADEVVCFAVFILDPVHEIEYAAVSSQLPARWLRWLDAPAPLTPASGDEGAPAADLATAAATPDEIREIVEGGGVDPREWVAEWVEESLSLAIGVAAQRYVARRMGVGEGGLGKGKMKVEDVIQAGGGELARASV